MPLRLTPDSTNDVVTERWAETIERDILAQQRKLDRVQTQSNTLSSAPINQSLPAEAGNISASESGYIIDGVLYSEVTCTYSAPNPLGSFAGIFLVIKGYRGSAELVKINEHSFFGAAGGSASFNTTLQRTGETVTLYFVAKNSNEEARTDWQNSVNTTVVLDGNASAPNTPIGWSISPQELGIALQWTENSELNIAGYNIYRNTVNNPATATKIASTAATKTGSGTYFDKTVLDDLSTVYFYWLTAVNTAFLESAKTSAVSGTVAGFSASTPLNPQGNVPGTGTANGFFTIDTADSGAGAASMIKFSWAAQTVYRADGTSFSIPAASSLSVPAAPTTGQTAGGALSARTYTVRVALVRNKTMYGISGEVTQAVSANNLLTVTSPSSVSNYDGWVPLVGPNVLNTEVTQDSNPPATPIAFGTNYTEPTGGANIINNSTHSRWTDDAITATQGARFWNLSPGGTFKFYPYYNIPDGRILFAGQALTALSAQFAAEQGGDKHITLSGGAISAVASSGGGSGSSSGGGGGGGPIKL